MSMFKFKVWRPDHETEADAIEIEAGYANEAAEQFFNEHVQGFESETEYDDLRINTRGPYGNVEEFKVEVTMEPVVYIRRAD